MSESICTHINHGNPALLIPCPACGEDWKYQIVHPSVLQELHERIIELEEESAEAHALLINSSPTSRTFDEAWEVLESALVVHPDAPDLYPRSEVRTGCAAFFELGKLVGLTRRNEVVNEAISEAIAEVKRSMKSDE